MAKIQTIKIEIMRLQDAGLLPVVIRSLETKASEIKQILWDSREKSLWNQSKNQMLFWDVFNDCPIFRQKFNTIKFWQELLF